MSQGRGGAERIKSLGTLHSTCRPGRGRRGVAGLRQRPRRACWPCRGDRGRARCQTHGTHPRPAKQRRPGAQAHQHGRYGVHGVLAVGPKLKVWVLHHADHIVNDRFVCALRAGRGQQGVHLRHGAAKSGTSPGPSSPAPAAPPQPHSTITSAQLLLQTIQSLQSVAVLQGDCACNRECGGLGCRAAPGQVGALLCGG